MLSARRLKVLSLALLMSGGTVVLTQQWLQGAVRKAQLEARVAAPATAVATGRRVLVANADLPAGAILTAAQLRWQAWPANAATSAYLTEDDTSLDKLTGAVVRTHLEAGEPLTRTRIAFPGDRSFLAAVLRPGYRAVTVNVSASSGVAGFVMPGDHVDLILSRTLGESADKRFVSETVLTDVRVVGVDQRAGDEKNEKKDVVVPQTATLEVTPKGAEVIAVVSELGRLSLSLRSLAAPETPAEEPRIVTRTSDREAVQAPTAVARAPRPAAPAAPPRETVEVVRGAQSAVVPAGPTYRVTPLDSRVPAFDVKQTAGGAP